MTGLSALVLALALVTSVAAQGAPSGEHGSLALGGSVEATLAPVQGEELVVYHTYVVTIPPGSGPSPSAWRGSAATSTWR